MCGICGFISRDDRAAIKTARIHRMMDSMEHRGPDDAREYIDANVALGFRRLAIIDIGGGRQPLSNEDGSVWVVFNGEIYNFIHLRSRLLALGHIFSTNADTEVIIHAYEEWGYGCLEYLDGMFAFAVWDRNIQGLFLAVDRVGIKPLYYNEYGNFVFASEAKALFASGFVSPEMDPKVLPYHMAFLWAPHPLTLFKNVKKLAPGHYLIVKDNKISEHQYWDLRIEEDSGVGLDQWAGEVRQGLAAAVESQMVSDVPLGAFLSGGIDSSAICHYMAEASSKPISTYFIAFAADDLQNDILMNEEPWADQMAEQLGSIHRKIIISPNIEGLIKELVWHMDEPVGDPAIISSYLVSKAARETLTVLLSGVGGDEVFAGYPRHLAMKILNSYRMIPGIGRASVRRIASLLPGGQNALFRNIKKFVKAAHEDEFTSYLEMLSYFNKKEQRKLFTDEFYDEIKQVDLYAYHRNHFEAAEGLNWLNRLQYLDFKTFLPCLNLLYTDKMSMAASIEVRVPFLDTAFVEGMFRMPPQCKLRGRERKYVFKKAMEPLLPAEVVWRKKAGFGAPVHSWIRGKLQVMIKDYLSPARIRQQGIFDADYIDGLLRDEFSNAEYLSNHIWQLFTFQLWHERFIES